MLFAATRATASLAHFGHVAAKHTRVGATYAASSYLHVGAPSALPVSASFADEKAKRHQAHHLVGSFVAIAIGIGATWNSSNSVAGCQPPDSLDQMSSTSRQNIGAFDASGAAVGGVVTGSNDVAPTAAAATIMPAPAVGATNSVESLAAGASSSVDGAASSNSSKSMKITEEQMQAMKARYYELLGEKEEKKKRSDFKYLKQADYDYTVGVLNDWVKGATHSQKDHQRQKKFYIGPGTVESCLYEKNSNKKVAIREELFDTIFRAHDHLGHPRTSRTTKSRLDDAWYGITEECVQLLVDVCCYCTASATKIKAKQAPLKMMLSPTIGYRTQMDLIDMTSQPTPDGYKWILRYYDHHSGFGHVAALKNKTALETGNALMGILGTAPLPTILQSDNGGEFLGHCTDLINK